MATEVVTLAYLETYKPGSLEISKDFKPTSQHTKIVLIQWTTSFAITDYNKVWHNLPYIGDPLSYYKSNTVAKAT